jgi:uncharacterized lipoprotein
MKRLLMKSKYIIKSLLGCMTVALLWGCDVEQTQEGKMPDVDVSVESGQLPEYDVDAPDIVVGTKEVEVEVPKVVMEKETIEVPVVGVDMPEDSDADVSKE